MNEGVLRSQRIEDMAQRPAFKAYDIRGLSPGEIDQKFAERLGRAIGTPSPALPLDARGREISRVLVGRDMRVTSPELEAALVEGLVASGIDVVKIGRCSTPLFNATIGLASGVESPSSQKSKVENAFDLGVMVTASHNPGKYNGFKITRGDCMPVGKGSGMEELAETFDRASGVVRRASSRGSVSEDPTALSRYVDLILSLAKLPTAMPKMKIAIDAGNGMAGAVLPELLKRLPWLEVVPLYFEPDGSFPNHEANPLKRETLTDLVRVVREKSCVAGVAFDGDADRVGFVDETGAQIPGDLLTALFAQEILVEHPDGLVLYDVRSSWSVPEAVAEAGGHAEMCEVGHANIKRLMREKRATFGGELSMHFYFKELWNCESGDLAMLLLLRRVARETKTLSELWMPLKRYAKSDEINFGAEDPVGAIERVEQRYAPEAVKIIRIDGVRVEFADWWFNLRASNTEPLLRLNLEAKTEEMLKEKIEELAAAITPSAPPS